MYYKIQCCIMTYLSQHIQHLVVMATVYHFVWTVKNTKIAKNTQEMGKKGVKKPTITRTTKAGYRL